MSSDISIPLTLKTGAGDGSIQQSDESLEQWMAYWASEKIVESFPDNASRYSKSLTLDPQNSDLIGSFTDTFYNEPVGTHPGTSITEGSTTTNLYQMADSASTTRFVRSYPIPVVVDTTTADIHEMPDSGILDLAQRIAGNVHLNGFAGAYRLSGNSPGAGWTKWIDGVFTDTKASGDYDYHIWRLTDNSAAAEPTVPTHFPLALKDGVSPDLREITKEETKEIAREILLIGQVGTGVGDYELRSSAQGAPTASGQWVARGTAIDTKHVVSGVQYTGPQYTTPAYTTQYVGQYSGTYTGISFAKVDVQYSGSRTFNFAGNRNYSGAYAGTRTYSGNYAGTRNYGAQYAGTRNFAGVRYFSGDRYFAANYSRPVKYFEQVPTSYSGNRYFAGSRIKPFNFAGVRQISYADQYTGFRSTYFSGVRAKDTPFGFAGVRFTPATFYTAYAGIRYFAGVRFFTQGYAGFSTQVIYKQYNGPINLNFSRPVPETFVNIRPFPPPTPTPQPAPSPSPGGGGQPLQPGFRPNSNLNRSVEGLEIHIAQADGSKAGIRESLADIIVSSFTAPNSDPTTLSFSGARTKFPFPGDTLIGGYVGTYAGVRWQYYNGVRIWQFSGVRYVPVTNYYNGFRAKPNNFINYNYYSRATPGYYDYYQQFTGNRLVAYSGQFLGPYPEHFTGSRSKATPQQFTGPFPFGQAYGRFNVPFGGNVDVTYSGTRQFAGSRAAGQQFATNSSFSSGTSFTGSRNYGRQYNGSRTYSTSYQGSRNYSGQYTGSRASQFTGQVPTTYSRQYTGQYTGTYAGYYTSQYSNQYTGQTITDQKETIETFTLYCRVAA